MWLRYLHYLSRRTSGVRKQYLPPAEEHSWLSMNKYNPRGCAYFHIRRLSSRHHSCTHRPDSLYWSHTVYFHLQPICQIQYFDQTIMWQEKILVKKCKKKRLKQFQHFHEAVSLWSSTPFGSRYLQIQLHYFAANAPDGYFSRNELLAYFQIQALPIHLLLLSSTAQRSITGSFSSSFPLSSFPLFLLQLYPV